MIRYTIRGRIWWIIPGELAGMPMPFVDRRRRKRPKARLNAYEDDLPYLSEVGIRSVASLVHGSARFDAVYGNLDFKYLFLPVHDGEAPNFGQVMQFVRFYEISPKACAVHCEGGVGRTGTMLAAFLMQRGHSASEALKRVRAAQPAAIESDIQKRFLINFQAQMKKREP